MDEKNSVIIMGLAVIIFIQVCCLFCPENGFYTLATHKLCTFYETAKLVNILTLATCALLITFIVKIKVTVTQKDEKEA